MAADRARVTLSIDLCGGEGMKPKPSCALLQEITSALQADLARYDLPATWAISHEVVDSLVPLLAPQRQKHELAILGEDWIGPGSSRYRFHRELQERLSQLQKYDTQVTTVALYHTELGGNLDLLRQAGISMIRKGRVAEAPIIGLQMVYRGLFVAPVTLNLPSTSRWDWTGGVRQALRVLQSVADNSGHLHLVIDGARLVRRGPSSISNILRHCAELHALGSVEIMTLRAFVECHAEKMNRSLVRDAIQSHSILRPAA